MLDPKRINLVLAIRAVKNKQLTIAQASRAYGLKFYTLYHHVKGRYKNSPKYFKKTGHHLTAAEESALAQYATVLSESGISVSRVDITKYAAVSTIVRVLLIKCRYF